MYQPSQPLAPLTPHPLLAPLPRHYDTDRGLRLPHLPFGRFLHVAPIEPSADWNTDFGTPWWQSKDHAIGKLSAKTRKVYVVNALTQQRDLLECAGYF